MNHTSRRYRALIQRLASLHEHEMQATVASLKQTVGQDLAEISSGLASLRRELKEQSEHLAAVHTLDAVTEHAREAVRQLTYAMQPPGPDDLGLLPALERRVTDFSASSGTTAEIQFSGRIPSLTRARRTVIDRVLEEALENIARHAKARHVEVRLMANRQALTLQVRDDGVGIAEADREKSGALGLFAIDEQLAAVGGALTVTRATGRGTMLEATVPVSSARKSAATLSLAASEGAADWDSGSRRSVQNS